MLLLLRLQGAGEDGTVQTAVAADFNGWDIHLVAYNGVHEEAPSVAGWDAQNPDPRAQKARLFIDLGSVRLMPTLSMRPALSMIVRVNSPTAAGPAVVAPPAHAIDQALDWAARRDALNPKPFIPNPQL